MLKTLTSIIATAFVAAAVLAPSTASAGCGGGHKGFFKSNASYSHSAKKRRARAAALKRAKARKLAAKKAKQRKIAAAKKAKAARLAAAKTEGTFVEASSTAAVLTKSELPIATSTEETKSNKEKVAQLDQPEKMDDANTCKRFVPAIGTTVTVDCE